MSLLPCFRKILEKIVEVKLQNHLDNNNLLSDIQFGFRRGKSTEHAIHSMVKDIHSSFDENKICIGIFLDIKKAFDSLDRSILLNKLRYYGICDNELKWFETYLANRKQFVTYNNCSSETRRVDFGVPQGGVVSPLLFLVYINDIVNCSNLIGCVLYADDTNLYLSSNKIDDLYLRANHALSNFKNWFDSNKLSLNADKTKYMIFHRKQRQLPSCIHKLYLDNLEVEKVNYAKFLGVVLDPHLSWNCHIANLSRKLSKYVPILYRIRNLCTPRSLKLIYNCLIYSNLIYCNSVWGYCKSVALNPLIVIHKKIVRALAGVGYNHHTTEIFNDLSFLNIRKINEYMVGIFTYKCLANEEFSTWFDYRTTNYVTRASEANPLTH